MRRLAVGVAAICFSLCAHAEQPTTTTPPAAGALSIRSVALAGELSPSVTALPDGGFVVTTLSRQGAEATLSAQTISIDGEPGSVRPVARGEGWFVNWADFPSLAIADNGDWVSFYLLKSDPSRPYAYDIMLLRSTDQGASWSQPQKLHDDDTHTEHGFVSLISASDPEHADAVVAVWLDGRRSAAPPAEGAEHEHEGVVTTLRSTVVFRDHIEPSVELDARTCDCCTTDAAKLGDQLVTVYRDRSLDEFRDIGFLRRRGGAWSAPAHVASDGWRIAGCPVNGPALTTSGGQGLATWPTMQGEDMLVRSARFVDGSWSAAQVIDRGRNVLGRVDLASWTSGQSLVSWLGASEQGTTLWLGIVDESGRLERRQPVATLPPGRSTGMPRLASSADRALLVWTEPGAERTRVVGAWISP
ncbi:MAG: exo-alpha-sialidase [Xanthomonadales bacterium]|nr:exo-alpha-sialidase [Xanthomonadales bacterium]